MTKKYAVIRTDINIVCYDIRENTPSDKQHFAIFDSEEEAEECLKEFKRVLCTRFMHVVREIEIKIKTKIGFGVFYYTLKDGNLVMKQYINDKTADYYASSIAAEMAASSATSTHNHCITFFASDVEVPA